MHERYLTMRFKPPAGDVGCDLPHPKIGATLPGLSKTAALASKCVGKWAAAAQGVAMVSWRSWRWDAVGQAEVLEVGCV